jgi:hypothetical protein
METRTKDWSHPYRVHWAFDVQILDSRVAGTNWCSTATIEEARYLCNAYRQMGFDAWIENPAFDREIPDGYARGGQTFEKVLEVKYVDEHGVVYLVAP